MAISDNTQALRSAQTFQTTRWTEIVHVQTKDESKRRLHLDALLTRYWKPIYVYLCRKGCDAEKAKDLTQGFIHEIVLEKSLIQQATPTKGRFRSYILTALNHYIANKYYTDSAQKRRPAGKLLDLDGVDAAHVASMSKDLSPEHAFNYAWASELLTRILTDVEEASRISDTSIYWNVFKDRVLDPIMKGTDPPALRDVCARYDIENEGRISNMIVTVKRRLKAAMTRHLQELVETDEQIEEEFNDLLTILAK